MLCFHDEMRLLVNLSVSVDKSQNSGIQFTQKPKEDTSHKPSQSQVAYVLNMILNQEHIKSMM